MNTADWLIMQDWQSAVRRASQVHRSSCGCRCSTKVSIYGYGSIPINTIFRGMNIHLPAILMFTRGTRLWHTAIYSPTCYFQKWFKATLLPLFFSGEGGRDRWTQKQRGFLVRIFGQNLVHSVALDPGRRLLALGLFGTQMGGPRWGLKTPSPRHRAS